MGKWLRGTRAPCLTTPFNVVPLADDKTLNIAVNIAALANTGAAMNLNVRMRLCLTPDSGVFSKLKQLACREYNSVGRIIIVV